MLRKPVPPFSNAIWNLILCAYTCWCVTTNAQAQMTPQRLIASTRQAPDLGFPAQPSNLSVFSKAEMAIYKPEGSGPFPALVLLHQCGGLRDGRWTNEAVLQWAKVAVARGYVAMIVDSLGPRDVNTVCFGAKGGVNFGRGVLDTLQAAEHLRSFDFVDKNRIALAGFSWGASNAIAASSKLWATALAPGQRFRAAVSFYPNCETAVPPTGNPYELVNKDIDQPLLVLMGGQDNETPAAECTRRLEAAKLAGGPVEWHVYPEVGHCWDCKNLHNFHKIDARGSEVTYRYDGGVTQDAERRMFEFIERAMGKP